MIESRPRRAAYAIRWFPPEPAITPSWFAQSLRRPGLDVEVPARISDHPTGEVSVHFLDAVAPERIRALTASAGLQVVCLRDDNLFRITVPSKAQPILACGRPLLACAPGEAARIVHAVRTGFTCPPGDPVHLAWTIRRAAATSRDRLRDMGCAGYDFYPSTPSERYNAHALAGLSRSVGSRGVSI